MTDDKEILKELLIDENDVKQQLATLVKSAKQVFVIDESGKIIFKDFSKLTNQARICALLTGKKFAKKLDLDVEDSLSISEIGKELEIPATTLSSPMRDLIKRGFVLKNGTKYNITYNRLPEIFSVFFENKKEQ